MSDAVVEGHAGCYDIRTGRGDGIGPWYVHDCPTCWRRYVMCHVGPTSRECWDCYDGVQQLWRDAFYRPETSPAWMVREARPWEVAA